MDHKDQLNKDYTEPCGIRVIWAGSLYFKGPIGCYPEYFSEYTGGIDQSGRFSFSTSGP